MFGLGALVVLVVLTAIVASRPKMQAIGGGADLAEKSAIVNALTAAGIAVDYDARGNIRVPQKDVGRAQLVLAEEGIGTGPSSGIGAGEMGVFTTKEVESAQLKAMTEANLSKTISSMNGVKSAIVHISLGDNSPFANAKKPAKASVTIIEASQGALTRNQGKAIARIVQNSVEGMTPESVSVITSYGQVLYDGFESNSAESLAVKKIEVEAARSARLEHKLQADLDQAFGPGNTIVSVQVEIGMDTVEIDEVEYTANEAVEIGRVSETVVGAGAAGASGGAAGAASNIGAPANAGAGGSSEAGNYSSETTQRSPLAPDTKRTRTTRAAGSLTAMTVLIMANSTAIEDMKPVTAIAESFLGANKGTPGFASTVTAIEFDTAAMKASEKAMSTVAGAELRQQIISIIPVIALVVVGFLVMRSIGKFAKKQRVVYAALPAGGASPMSSAPVGSRQGPASIVGPSTAGAQGPIEDARGAPVGDIEAGQQLTEAIESGNTAEALRIIEQAPDDPEVLAIKQKVDVPLEQIKHMAKTKPETVAMLLKGWMMEDMR
ncbi:MAG: hypothetical protein IH944_05855 [Armatimonadetes bacterium]|nr:hypothetical protein [Armatimonadota bacterium]